MPGVKCGCCRKFLTPTDGAKCEKCNVYYHRVCAALPRKGAITSSWHCGECKRSIAKITGETGDSPYTVSPGIAESVGDFELELRHIREELRSVRSEFQAFREELADIRALVSRVDKMEKRLDDLEVLGKHTTIISNVDEVVDQLKRDMNERDQELLANDVEITNIPECSGENLTHTIKIVATKLGVSLEDRDIVEVSRVGGRHINATQSSGPTETRPRPIVVRISSRYLRDAFVQGARVRRGANTADLDLPGQPRRFYVNERLTKINRMLFRQARQAGQRNGWKFVWTSRGRILARHKPGDAVCRIRCEADIQCIFGNE